MSDTIIENYREELKSDYLQMGHHGNGGLSEEFYRLVEPKSAFFDAPDWLNESGGSGKHMDNAPEPGTYGEYGR